MGLINEYNRAFRCSQQDAVEIRWVLDALAQHFEKVGSELGSQHLSDGRFAETGWADHQCVIKSAAVHLAGVDGDRNDALYTFLADDVPQR